MDCLIMEQKKSNLSYNLFHSKLLKISAVSIGFIAHTNISSLNFLNGICDKIYEKLNYENVDVAAVCLAIYKVIMYKLETDSVNEVKSKINIHGCGYNNGQFFISATMPIQITSIKKYIALVLK